MLQRVWFWNKVAALSEIEVIGMDRNAMPSRSGADEYPYGNTHQDHCANQDHGDAKPVRSNKACGGGAWVARGGRKGEYGCGRVGFRTMWRACEI